MLLKLAGQRTAALDGTSVGKAVRCQGFLEGTLAASALDRKAG